MQPLGHASAFLMTVAAVLAGGGNALASEHHRCTTYLIRECGPLGCTEVAGSATIELDVAANTYRYCFNANCRTGGLETWLGRIKPDDKGILGFSQLGKAKGFSGSLDLDKGELVLIDEPRYLFGRCGAE